MTFHFYKGCVAWELQVGKFYAQLRLPAKQQTAGIILGSSQLPLFAIRRDPFGEWL